MTETSSSIEMDLLPLSQSQETLDNKLILLNAARNGDWEKVTNILDEHASTYHFITEAVDFDRRTLLHHACEIKENKLAVEKVTDILDKADILASSQGQMTEYLEKALPAFVDKAFYKDNCAISAIHIAAERKNKRLVELLLENGANVNLPENGGDKEAIRLIYRKLPKVILELFDKRLELTLDDDDSNEDLLNVKWDFTPITGVLPHSRNNTDDNNRDSDKVELIKTSQTFLLSNALREQELDRSEIVLHPLVRIFLYYKHKKFNGLIIFSMIYHILWSLLSIIFIVHNAHFPVAVNETLQNITVKDSTMTIPNGDDDKNNYPKTVLLWMLFCIYACLYILTFTKECLELCYCPSLRYYWNQLENYGQWILLISVFLVGFLSLAIRWLRSCSERNGDCYMRIVYLTNVTSTAGIFSAGLLVLGQFNKTKTLGIYMEMLSKVTKNVTRFLLFFSPLIITYAVIFRLLMPEVPAFGAPWVISKVMTMMAGEINYDDVFHGDNMVPLPGLTKFLFLCFVVTVIIVLQNLLIGLTLSDIEMLNKYAEENHYAKQLEQIYLLENFLLLPKIKWVIMKLRMGKWLEGLMVEPVGPEPDSSETGIERMEGDNPGRKLEDLPNKIQKIIRKEVDRRFKKMTQKSLSDLTRNATY